MHLKALAAACVFFAIGCKQKATNVPPPTVSEAAVERTCTESVGHGLFVNESSLTVIATDGSDRTAQLGKYAVAAIDVCARQGWPVAIRNCLARGGDGSDADRRQTNECFRLLTPQQRVELATALIAVETRITNKPADSAPALRFPWLAP